jgi:hypothetical protein
MTDFSPARIAELRALAEKATKGPWRQHLVDDTVIIDYDGNTIAETFPEGGVDDKIDYDTDTEQREHNAAFIAAARDALPAALDEIERLRAENEKLREALKPFARLRRVFGGKEPDDIPSIPDSHGYVVLWAMDQSGRCDLTLGQFRRARRALEGGAS